MADEKKKFTWRNLKDAIEAIPEELLDKEVFVWREDDGLKITGTETLQEDYRNDGDEGCAPESLVKKYMSDGESLDGDYPVVHKKGTMILLSL